MKAYGNQVLVKRTKAPESIGGIIIPENVATEYKLRGTVISAGPAIEMIDPEDLIDKEIVFSKASSFKILGEEYIVVNEEDILAIL
jgi:co-chaperonin GroES (HSP10)